MKKIFLAVVIPLIAAGAAKAAELEDGKFYEDVLISDDLKMEDSSNSAKEKASSLLDQKPKIIKIEGEPLQFRSARTKAAPAAPVGGKPIDTTTKYGEAPFGLSWGATYNQTKALGVDMERVERKDSVNDFIVTKLPKPIADFRQVIVSFGENNSLWRPTAAFSTTTPRPQKPCTCTGNITVCWKENTATPKSFSPPKSQLLKKR